MINKQLNACETKEARLKAARFSTSSMVTVNKSGDAAVIGCKEMISIESAGSFLDGRARAGRARPFHIRSDNNFWNRNIW